MKNKLSNYSLLVSVPALILFDIFSLLAIASIILGVMALNEIKTTGEEGKEEAIIAIVISTIAIILAIFA